MRKRSIKIIRIGSCSAHDQKITIEDGEGGHTTLSVAQYFVKTYGYKLEFPNYPRTCPARARGLVAFFSRPRSPPPLSRARGAEQEEGRPGQGRPMVPPGVPHRPPG